MKLVSNCEVAKTESSAVKIDEIVSANQLLGGKEPRLAQISTSAPHSVDCAEDSPAIK